MSRALSIIAIIVAAAALAASLLIPGPEGPQGPQGEPGTSGTAGASGAEGPAGLGSPVATSYVSVNPPIEIGGVCTNLTGAEVTITAPTPGTVVFTARTGFYINHLLDWNDAIYFYVGVTPTDCPMIQAWLTWPEPEPTALYPWNAEVIAPIDVPSAGTYAYFLNARMAIGRDPGDQWEDATIVAVFYPSQ